MLMKSDISPFDSQETKPYKDDPRVSAMTDLVDAYQRDDIDGYEKILQTNKDLLADPFIAENIDEVTRNMRTKAVLKLIAPYTQFTLEFVSKHLKIPLAEVEDILSFLIVDKQVRGKIDQQGGIVQVESRTDMDRMNAVQDWGKAINNLWNSVLLEEGYRLDEAASLAGHSGHSGHSGHPMSMKMLNGGVGRMKVGNSASGPKRPGGVLR
jgi:COP9 signalosome complex subunit 2